MCNGGDPPVSRDYQKLGLSHPWVGQSQLVLRAALYFRYRKIDKIDILQPGAVLPGGVAPAIVNADKNDDHH